MAHEIPWRESTAPALPAELRAELARVWAYRQYNEAGAAKAFERLHGEWRAAGASAELVDAAAAAADEEAQHAAICGRFVELYSGGAAPEPKPFADMPRYADATVEERALFGAVLMCAISESVACVYLQTMLERAADAPIRAVHELFLAHDIRHSRLGWAYLAFDAHRSPDRVRALAERLPGMLALYRSGLGVRRPTALEHADELLAGHGALRPGESRELFDQALDNVLLPGFAEFGIPPEQLRENLRRENLRR
ncbi:MAG: hypothetical protein KC503_25680 [Myxococcales bacterium]|nr:hypothetical protein [Myxococcales bacterium]